MRAAVLALAEHVDDDQEAFRAKSLLIRQVPSLRARSADRTGEWQRVLAEGVAQRLGTDAERDLRAQVIAASTVAAPRRPCRCGCRPAARPPSTTSWPRRST
ncbi:MAG: hypothetical protein R2699_05710 [Acidimicrobiales bacterium]